MPSPAGADARARFIAATLDAVLSELQSPKDKMARSLIADARKSALRLADMLAPSAAGTIDESGDECCRIAASNVLAFPTPSQPGRAAS